MDSVILHDNFYRLLNIELKFISNTDFDDYLNKINICFKSSIKDTVISITLPNLFHFSRLLQFLCIFLSYPFLHLGFIISPATRTRLFLFLAPL